MDKVSMKNSKLIVSTILISSGVKSRYDSEKNVRTNGRLRKSPWSNHRIQRIRVHNFGNSAISLTPLSSISKYWKRISQGSTNLSLSLSPSDVAETGRKRSPAEEDDDRKGGVGPSTSLKKKKKKSHSLVRKLSLNKFRLSTEQEPRHTPEGGDSSRSQSQSSQESPSLSDSPSRIARKGQEAERLECEAAAPPRDTALHQVDEEKGKPRKPEKPTEKLASTVTVVQRKSPSLTIKSFSSKNQNGEPSLSLSLSLSLFGLCYTDTGRIYCFELRDLTLKFELWTKFILSKLSALTADSASYRRRYIR